MQAHSLYYYAASTSQPCSAARKLVLFTAILPFLLEMSYDTQDIMKGRGVFQVDKLRPQSMQGHLCCVGYSKVSGLLRVCIPDRGES